MRPQWAQFSGKTQERGERMSVPKSRRARVRLNI
nr:MAG TPA: hypothetical protein [Caudoviricetes sp.]